MAETIIDKVNPPQNEEGQRHLWSRRSAAVSEAGRSTLAVGMIARDCGERMGATLSVVDDIAANFKEAAVYVLTNDNKDNTADVLASYEFRSSTTFSWDERFYNRPHLGGTREAARTVALAEYRNEVRRRLPKSDYVLILDADMLEITEARLMAGLGDMLAQCWHAMAAQCMVYVKSLEEKHFLNYDSFAHVPMWAESGTYMTEVSFRYDLRPTGSMPFRVKSAFGGACWYDGEKYHEPGREYNGEHGCEHVPFHRNLVMGVSPTMSIFADFYQ